MQTPGWQPILCVAWYLIWQLQVQKKVWSYMTPNVLTETRCHQTTQTKPLSLAVLVSKMSLLVIGVCPKIRRLCVWTWPMTKCSVSYLTIFVCVCVCVSVCEKNKNKNKKQNKTKQQGIYFILFYLPHLPLRLFPLWPPPLPPPLSIPPAPQIYHFHQKICHFHQTP